MAEAPESPTTMSAPEALRKDVEHFDTTKLKKVEGIDKTPSQSWDMTLGGKECDA